MVRKGYKKDIENMYFDEYDFVFEITRRLAEKQKDQNNFFGGL